jgi:serine/threonine-protein kinase
MDNYIGMKLDGRYELLELIGTGGMAEIYKADDTVEEKTVAVKILKNEFASNEEFLRRFRNEAKAIALLSHPNIAKIFDVGFTESVQFIVMEYIDGITLIDYIERQGVLKWREALGFIRQILKALQHAHDRGIVHRDVKSQNVMLLRDGTIKVMDFGIARFNREIDKTMSEKAIGSVHYISPEQARGDITDEKSDLYSVGVMLYEMLTGIKPFDGDDALAIALMHTNKTPKRPMEVNASIPEGLEEITLRAMQKEPVKRYQTAGEMLGDLQEFEKNPSIIFEYKYSTPDGNTKYFDKVGKPTAPIIPEKPVEFDEDDDEYDDDELIERRSPLLPILFAVASAVVIVAAVVVALLFGGVIGDPNGNGIGGPWNRNQEVPNLVGMDYEQAANAFGDWLKMVPVMEYSTDYSRGTIMWQDVAAGQRINPNQVSVNVRVSQGAHVIEFPDFISAGTLWPAEGLVKQLEDMGLRVQTRQEYHDTIPAAHFIRSDRQPGDILNLNDRVLVVVSLGSETQEHSTNVPDMVGSSFNVARDNAQRMRLTLIRLEEPSSEEMRDRIVRQSHPPHEQVQNGTEITVWVGTGPQTDPTRESFISFTVEGIPPEWEGDYEFKRYINGELVEPPRNFLVENGRTINWEFSNTGKVEYSIRIRNPRNGEEFLYTRQEIDFSTDPPTRNMITPSDPHILSKLNPAPEQTPAVTEDPYDPYDFPWNQ